MTKFSPDLMDGQELMTLQGGKVTIHMKEDEVYVNGAKIVRPNIITNNGVVHVIDGYVLTASVNVPVVLMSAFSVF